MSTLVTRLRTFQRRWTAGRRAAVPAGLVALIGAVAVSGLVAAADGTSGAHAAAKASHPRPKYLLPVGTLVQRQYLPGPVLTGDDGTVGVPPGTPRPPAQPDPQRAAAQRPVIATYRGADGTLTPAGIATLALSAGCDPGAAVIATAVAMAESGGSPSAQGDVGLMDATWDWSAGLWQIRGLRAERNTGGLRDSVANQAVEKNAAAMHEISSGCRDWTPWSTYNTGAYLQFVTIARQAVGYVVRWFNAHGHHYPPVPAPDPNAPVPSGAAVAAGPGEAAAAAGHSSSRPRAGTGHTTGRTTTAPARQGSSSAAPAPAHSSRPAGSGGGGGAPQPAPAPTPTPTKPGLPVPLPTLTVPNLPTPTPTLTLPKLPTPSLSLPKLP